jgi:signal transduction histidine kinase
VDLVDALHAVIDRTSEPLNASHSTLTLDASTPVVGHWDRSLIEQVFAHLLSNAIKFGQGGPIEVDARAEGDVARLVVRDHGIGITPAARARIFDRFERAASSRHYGGFGLGLYIVRRIVEGFGGSVECASALGEGSTFTVLLPREAK